MGFVSSTDVTAVMCSVAKCLGQLQTQLWVVVGSHGELWQLQWQLQMVVNCRSAHQLIQWQVVCVVQVMWVMWVVQVVCVVWVMWVVWTVVARPGHLQVIGDNNCQLELVSTAIKDIAMSINMFVVIYTLVSTSTLIKYPLGYKCAKHCSMFT